MGATHVFDNSTGSDFVNEFRSLTNAHGTTITLDCTGSIAAITDGLEATAKLGQTILVGTPPLGSEFNLPIRQFLVVHRQQNSMSASIAK